MALRSTGGVGWSGRVGGNLPNGGGGGIQRCLPIRGITAGGRTGDKVTFAEHLLFLDLVEGEHPSTSPPKM